VLFGFITHQLLVISYCLQHNNLEEHNSRFLNCRSLKLCIGWWSLTWFKDQRMTILVSGNWYKNKKELINLFSNLQKASKEYERKLNPCVLQQELSVDGYSLD
jgi:hypothetical protein